jgi:hypothetical protein
MLDEISTHVLGGFVYRTIGTVSPSTRDLAEEMMSELTLIAFRPVTGARLKIHHDEERPTAERYLAQGSMEVAGHKLRTEAAASTAEEAVSWVGRGLDRRLQMISERKQRAGKRPRATPGARWRRENHRAPRPCYRERLPERRLLLRRKTYRSADSMTIDEALLSLALLDFRMFLFTDEAHGVASIVFETEDGITLKRIDGSPTSPDNTLGPRVVADPSPAPSMTTLDAVSRMNLDDRPFFYFRDRDRKDAAAIYRRFDGHYGMIAPI